MRGACLDTLLLALTERSSVKILEAYHQLALLNVMRLFLALLLLSTSLAPDHYYLYYNITGPRYSCVAQVVLLTSGIFIWYSKRQGKVKTRTAGPDCAVQQCVLHVYMLHVYMLHVYTHCAPTSFSAVLIHCSRPAPQVLKTCAPFTSMSVGVVRPLLMPHSIASARTCGLSSPNSP